MAYSKQRVPYTFFVTREWAFFYCVKREWGFIFFVIRESIFLRPRETGFRFLRDPWNMYLLTRDLWNVIAYFFCEREAVFRIFRDAWKGQLLLRETVFRRGIGDPLNREGGRGGGERPWSNVKTVSPRSNKRCIEWNVMREGKSFIFSFLGTLFLKTNRVLTIVV